MKYNRKKYGVNIFGVGCKSKRNSGVVNEGV